MDRVIPFLKETKSLSKIRIRAVVPRAQTKLKKPVVYVEFECYVLQLGTTYPTQANC